MLRIHFTAQDLARLQVRASWGPLAETVFSLCALREPRSELSLRGWQRRAREQLDQHRRGQEMLELLRPFGQIDLVTVAGEADSMDEALDALLGAADDHLSHELAPLEPDLANASSWARTWLRELHDGDRTAREQLVSCMRAYHRSTVAPFWDGIRAQLEADRAVRSRHMTDGGVEQLLATLHPRIRWRPSVLEVDRPPVHHLHRPPGTHTDFHLDGRSLVLVPSVFLRHPIVDYNSADDTAAPLLFYPAMRQADDDMAALSTGDLTGRPALEALLGRTRATALDATVHPCTTTELARWLGVSPSTASHHASVLREAGLISTRRHGGAVLHSISARGAMLLDGGTPRSLREPGVA